MRQIFVLLIFAFIYMGIQEQTPIRLGINFPMRNPETASIPTYMNLVVESGAQIVRQLTFGDVVWRHLEPQDDLWDFTYADSVFLGFPELNYTGTLYSLFMEDTVGYQVPWKACTNQGNPACRWIAARDSNDTKQYLDTVIGRYGNIIKYWELGNEVENHGYPEGFPLPQLIQFFSYNYRWIKFCDNTAKIVIPSFVGTYGVPMQGKYTWLRDFFSLGGGNFIDIIAYHDYNSWWTIPLHLDSVIAVRNAGGYPNMPIWLTESSVSSNSTPITPGYASVDEQAADVWRRPCLAWSKGAELYYWHSLWSSGPPSEWQEFGIVDHFGKKKKSFHAYQLLANKLTTFTSAELVSHGVINDDNDNGGNGVWVVKFLVDGQIKWVMWSPDNQPYTLYSSSATEYFITGVVPYHLSPDGQFADFEMDSISVMPGSSHTFDLTSLPILVEEQDITGMSVDQVADHHHTFPTPANSHITLDLPGKSANNFVVDISDVAGIIFYHTTIVGGALTRIKTSDWPDGIYFYRAVSDRETILGKILISH